MLARALPPLAGTAPRGSRSHPDLIPGCRWRRRSGDRWGTDARGGLAQRPTGFNSFCEQNQRKAGYACPGVPANKQENAGTTAPDEGLDVLDTTTGRVTQAVVVPTSNDPAKTLDCGKGFNCFSYGVTFSLDGKHVYAAGGGGQDIVAFSVSGHRLVDPVSIPVPNLAARVPADPIIGSAYGYPHGIAATPDGRSLVVVDTYDSTVELFGLGADGTPSLVAQQLLPGAVPGQFPVAYLYDVVVDATSTFAYVTAEGTGVVYAVNLAVLGAAGTTVTPVPPPALATPVILSGVDHPTGIALSPDGSRLAVTGTDTDNVAFVPLQGGVPVDAGATLVRLGVVPRAAGVFGSASDAVAFARDGQHAYVAMAGDDADAVVALAGATPTVTGYLPTGWYPTAVSVGPDGRLWTVSAKGLGSRYVAGVGGYSPAPGMSLPGGASLPSSDYYDAENMPGLLTAVPVPADADLSGWSALAADDVLHAGGLDQRSADNPVPAAVGGSSPITHVVYIVRENRTFDQVFGDLALTRQDADADPADQELAAATPNAHALAGRYSLADHYFSDGEASVQGHWWTTSANVDDYVEKDWRQYYSPRHAPGDSSNVPVTTPPGCSLFQAAAGYQLAHPTFTYLNLGETTGLLDAHSGLGNLGANTCQNGLPADAASNGFSDPNYSTDLTPDDRQRAAEFLKDAGLNADGGAAGNGNSLSNFSYVIMSEDHTSGLAGTQTPRSQVAQNDQAVGQVVAALSRSAYWSSTAVFVTEDDSQDGTDHIDGHRNIALVASPYAKQLSGDGCLTGYLRHAHYDQASMVRTIELILGFAPLSSYDSGATPMFDLFQDKDSAASLTKADLAPYDDAPAPAFVDETVASLPHTRENQAMITYSKQLDTTDADIDEAGVESVLWHTVRADPLPAGLAKAAAGGDDDAAAPSLLAGETASAAADSGSRPPSALPESRSGTPPALSTVTGHRSPARHRPAPPPSPRSRRPPRDGRRSSASRRARARRVAGPPSPGARSPAGPPAGCGRRWPQRAARRQPRSSV